MGTVAASFLFNTKFPMPGMSWAFNTYKMNEYISERKKSRSVFRDSFFKEVSYKLRYKI